MGCKKINKIKPRGFYLAAHLIRWVSDFSLKIHFISVQLLCCGWLFVTLRAVACQASLSITNTWSLFKLMSIELVMPPSHLILCCPLLLLHSIFPSIRVFSKSFCNIGWPKYWNFNFSISPSNEYSRLISFRIGWFGLLAIQGTVKGFPQHHSSKASIIWHSAFFLVHNFHIHASTGKTAALTRQTLVSRIMPLIFNMLSRLVTAFLSWSKCLFISWLQWPSAVILEPKKIKSVTVSIVS